MRNDFCPVKGRKADDTECATIIYNATDAMLAVCRTCERGKALLGTVNPCRAAQPANAQQGPAKTAWQMVVESTGHTSQGRLADAIGTNQTKISQMFQKLGKGRLPSGEFWDALLQLSGFSAQTLLAAATGKPLPLPSSLPITPAASPSLPKPSGPVSSSAGPEGALTEAEESFLDELESPATPPASTLPDPEDCECNEGHGPCGACYSCRPDLYALINGKSVLLADLPPLSQHLLDVAQLAAEDAANNDKQSPAIPDDFLPYLGIGSPQEGAAYVSFSKAGEIGISSGAVRAYGLERVERVRLFWSPRRSQVGIFPGDGPGSRKMQVIKAGCVGRSVTARAFVKEFGITPAPGQYPVSIDPSGLIVATISQQPSQGGAQ